MSCNGKRQLSIEFELKSCSIILHMTVVLKDDCFTFDHITYRSGIGRGPNTKKGWVAKFLKMKQPRGRN